MLVQEPLQAAIWHCLNHYDYADALFLAERLFAEVGNDESLFLLATCYYRSGRAAEAYDALSRAGCRTPQTKFLLAKCCADLRRLSECETVLAGPTEDQHQKKGGQAEDAVAEFGDAAAFALRLLANVYKATERGGRAVDCEKAALSLNPLMWGAFETLCGLGQCPDPNTAFKADTLTDLTQVTGLNPILTLANTVVAATAAATSPGLANSTISDALAPVSTPTVPLLTVTSTPNLMAPASPKPQTPSQMITPMNANAPSTENSISMDTFEHTPNNRIPSSQCPTSRLMSGIGALNFSDSSLFSSAAESPHPPSSFLPTPSSTRANAAQEAVTAPRRPQLPWRAPAVGSTVGGCVAPHIQGRRRFRPPVSPDIADPSPTAHIIASYAADGATPRFGTLSRLPLGRAGNVALRLDFSSPSVSILSPCPSTALATSDGSPALMPAPECAAPTKQKRATVISNRENPLKPSNLLSQQSSNLGQTGVGTPQTNQQTPNVANMGGGGGGVGGGGGGGGVGVRRSSRLFGSTQSVKENSGSKAGAPKKTRAGPGGVGGSGAGGSQRSPTQRPNRPKTRTALATQQQQQQTPMSEQQMLAEKNEKNKESPEDKKPLAVSTATTAPSGTPANVLPQVINLGVQATAIQKQSLEGLLQLLRVFGSAYVELSGFNCNKAIDLLQSTPSNHHNTGWVLGLLGRAHFELAEYKEAKEYFKSLREREPYRLDFMEYYSTALWHLQDEVGLAALAQDLTKVGRNQPQAWCAAGNCFSHLKEHENAIRFFQRAVQVDSGFAYAYTLLGHEYVAVEELDKALACFRSAARADARHYNAWYGIGLTYYKQERYQLADLYYRKASAINPANPILLCHVAVVQHAMQRTEKALATLDHALAMAPRNSLCKFERASILFAAERYSDALKELQELKEIAPKESPIYFLLGKVHNKLNNTHLALMHFSWAMDLDPKGANSQIKDALDPAMNKAAQEESGDPANAEQPPMDHDEEEAGEEEEEEEEPASDDPPASDQAIQMAHDEPDLSGSFNHEPSLECVAEDSLVSIDVTPPSAAAAAVAASAPPNLQVSPSPSSRPPPPPYEATPPRRALPSHPEAMDTSQSEDSL